jgi:hypothetical protein
MESWPINIAFRSLLIFIGSFTFACSLDQSPPEAALNRSDNESVQQSPDVREVQFSGGGRGLVKAEGWLMPDLSSIDNNEQFKVQGAKTLGGIEVDVKAAKYSFEFGNTLLSSDMAAVLGWGDLNVRQVNEYKAKDRTFAYMYLVNPVELDEETKKIKSSRGFVFYFAVYDEDGDGIFETVAVGEPSVTRSLRPHVPAWAAK